MVLKYVGAGYLAMCGRAFKPNAMFMWPNGRAAIMGPDQAATTLARGAWHVLSLLGPYLEADAREHLHMLAANYRNT